MSDKEAFARELMRRSEPMIRADRVFRARQHAELARAREDQLWAQEAYQSRIVKAIQDGAQKAPRSLEFEKYVQDDDDRGLARNAQPLSSATTSRRERNRTGPRIQWSEPLVTHKYQLGPMKAASQAHVVSGRRPVAPLLVQPAQSRVYLSQKRTMVTHIATRLEPLQRPKLTRGVPYLTRM